MITAQDNPIGLNGWQFPGIRSQQDAGNAACQVEGGGSERGLIKVINIKDEFPVLGDIGAEVFKVQVAALQQNGSRVWRAEASLPLGGEKRICASEERKYVLGHAAIFEQHPRRNSSQIGPGNFVDDRGAVHDRTRSNRVKTVRRNVEMSAWGLPSPIRMVGLRHNPDPPL